MAQVGGEVAQAAPPGVKPVDTTGAGDAFVEAPDCDSDVAAARAEGVRAVHLPACTRARSPDAGRPSESNLMIMLK